MSTARQIAANRQNARKSRGPTTDAGKAASSGNARRHGLTGALGVNALLPWYRAIVEDETAVPDPFEKDLCLLAATDLARAEAHLQRIRKAEEQWLLGPKARLTKDEKIRAMARDLLDTLLRDAESGRRRMVLAGPASSVRGPLRLRADIGALYGMLEEEAQRETVSVGWDPKGRALLARLDAMIEGDFAKLQLEDEKQGPRLAHAIGPPLRRAAERPFGGGSSR